MTIFTLTATVSRLLITISPFCILYSIARRKRSVVAISGETLLLLLIPSVYFALPDLLSLRDVASKIHILALGVAAYYVVKFQSKMYIPDSAQSLLPLQPPTSTQPAPTYEEEVEEGEEDEGERPTKKIPDFVKFSPLNVIFFLIQSFIAVLLTGDHSLIIRFMKWCFPDLEKPNEAFWTHDVPHMTYYFFIIVQTNAILFQSGRIITFHRLSVILKDQVGEKIAKKLKVPKGVWASLLTFHLGQGLMLPSLFKQISEMGKEDERMDDLVMRIVGAAMVSLYLIGLVCVLRFMPKPKKEVNAEAGGVTAEVNQQTVSSV